MLSQVSRRASMAGYLAVIAMALVGTLSTSALAHHPMGGATPATFMNGLLSGLGHPVIGLDHLAFIVAVGIASAFIAKRWLAPAVFIVATVIGCLLALNFGVMPRAELLIAASVVLVGVMILSGREIATPVYLSLFAVAGILHGGAYAEAVVGAEATPIAAYLIGFALIQYAVAAAMMLVTHETWKASSVAALQPRLAGAVVAGIGAAMLVGHVEKIVFPGM